MGVELRRKYAGNDIDTKKLCEYNEMESIVCGLERHGITGNERGDRGGKGCGKGQWKTRGLHVGWLYHPL